MKIAGIWRQVAITLKEFKNYLKMMTPTVTIEFRYELLMSGGNTIYTRVNTECGAYAASEHLKAHGLTLSFSSILNAKKERTFLFDKLPYNTANSEKEVISYFNGVFGIKDLSEVVAAHISFKRI